MYPLAGALYLLSTLFGVRSGQSLILWFVLLNWFLSTVFFMGFIKHTTFTLLRRIELSTGKQALLDLMVDCHLINIFVLCFIETQYIIFRILYG